MIPPSVLAGWILAHRSVLILLTLAVVALAGLGTLRLGFSMEYRDFFDSGDPRVAAFDELQKTYAKSDNVLFVVAPESADVFTRETLEAVEWLTQRAWRLPFASRVDSLTNYQHSVATEEQVAIEDLVAHPRLMSDEELDTVRRVALGDVLLVNRMVSKQGHVTGVNVTFRLPGVHNESETRDAVEAAHTLVREFHAQFPTTKVFVSGTLTISHAFFEVTLHDLTTLIPLMFGVLAIVLTLVMRSLAGACAAFLVVIGATTVAFGVAGLLGMRLTPPAAAAAPIIMTLAIADCVHLFSTYTRRVAEGSTGIEAMRESIVVNFGAVTLTSITTAIGFSTMNLADSPPFHDLGNLVTIGVLAAYVMSLTLFACVVSYFKPPARTSSQPLMEGYARFAVAHSRALLFAALLGVMSFAVFIPRIELNDEFLKYFDESVPFRRDNDFITRELTGVYQFIYSLPAAGAEGVSDPEYLARMDEFARWYRAQPEVWHVESLTDVLKRINQSAHADDPAYYRLPQTREQASQLLLLLEMSLPIGLDLNDRISVDRSATRFTVAVKTLPAKQLLDLERRAMQWLTEHAPPTMRVGPTGPALLFAHIGMNSIKTGLVQEASALLLISSLLVVALRSVRIGLLSLVPNIVPAVAAFGLWGLLHGQINMAMATVAAMALGIIVDDTIHLLSKYLYARRVQALSAAQSVHYAICEVGNAVVATSLTLIAGFLALTPSPFVMNWGMGQLTAMTLLFAMLFDLTMLPGLLLMIDKEKVSEPLDLALSER